MRGTDVSVLGLEFQGRGYDVAELGMHQGR